MALLGPAALVMWHDLPAAVTTEHGSWHSKEHLPERVDLPGFLRGRRAIRRNDEKTTVLLLYELNDLSAMTMPAYLSRLDNPTPDTERFNRTVFNFDRSPCHVLASAGFGIGGAISTLRLGSNVAEAGKIMDSVANGLDRLHSSGLVLGAHILSGEAEHIRPTREQALRGGADAHSSLVVIVEGFEQEGLRSAIDDWLRDLDLDREIWRHDSYALAHIA